MTQLDGGIPHLQENGGRGSSDASQTHTFLPEALNIWKLHISFCPRSSGKVEESQGNHQTAAPLSSSFLNSSYLILPSSISLSHLQGSMLSHRFKYQRRFLLSHHLPAQAPPLAGCLCYRSLLLSLLCLHADSYLPAPTPEVCSRVCPTPQGTESSSTSYLPSLSGKDPTL